MVSLEGLLPRSMAFPVPEAVTEVKPIILFLVSAAWINLFWTLTQLFKGNSNESCLLRRRNQ